MTGLWLFITGVPFAVGGIAANYAKAAWWPFLSAAGIAMCSAAAAADRLWPLSLLATFAAMTLSAIAVAKMTEH